MRESTPGKSQDVLSLSGDHKELQSYRLQGHDIPDKYFSRYENDRNNFNCLVRKNHFCFYIFYSLRNVQVVATTEFSSVSCVSIILLCEPIAIKFSSIRYSIRGTTNFEHRKLNQKMKKNQFFTFFFTFILQRKYCFWVKFPNWRF